MGNGFKLNTLHVTLCSHVSLLQSVLQMLNLESSKERLLRDSWCHVKPHTMNGTKNTLQRKLVRNAWWLWSGRQGESDGSKRDSAGKCNAAWGEWASARCRTCLSRTGGCGGTRTTEECRSYVSEERDSTGEEGQMMSEDQRSSVSGMEAVSERRARTRSIALFSARRHSFTLRKVWTWTRAGKACTEEDRETGADRESKQGSSQCAERMSGASPHPLRKTRTDLKTNNQEEETATSQANSIASCPWGHVERTEVLKCLLFSIYRNSHKPQISQCFRLCTGAWKQMLLILHPAWPEVNLRTK